MVKSLAYLLLLGASCFRTASGFSYGVTGAGNLALKDSRTDISDIVTLFTDQPIAVAVSGIEWGKNDGNNTADQLLRWETSVDGLVQAEGTYNLTELDERKLLSDLDCGTIRVSGTGRHEVSVTLSVDDSKASTGGEYQAFAQGAAIIPLIVVLFLALTTHMVEFSLLFAIFVGACMVSGNLKDGFKSTLDTYILEALADGGHAFVYLFTLFLSGLVAMLEKSGGMIGFTRAIARYATSPRAGQFATFVIGCVIFFDDYANALLAGETMRPLTDVLFISREKLSFIVDATAAPIASLTPISSWVGFEVGLIQTEIDRIKDIVGAENLTIESSGLAVFLQSIKYRYYPIFMMILIPVLIYTQRDFGPMLIAERKTQVYRRTDGGDGKGPASKAEDAGAKKENAPRPDTPAKAWNMALPIFLLVFFIFYLLVKSGDDGSGAQTFLDKIENSDSYVALLWGTMAAANTTTLFYLVQIVYQGELVIPTFDIIKGLFQKEPESETSAETENLTSEDGEDTADKNEEETFPVRPRPLMSLHDSVEAFLYGMARIFPALIVLTLAWASGSIMTAVGADRLFSRWIVGGISAEALPTLSFVISLFMALATGTSWGTMTILFPLICLPTYQVADGDPQLFYATVAGILSGSVCGDHVSPISDTTVLSALASDCKLLAHVTTQAPYAAMMSVLAIIFGTVPIGRGAWPNIVGILLAVLAIVLIAYGICVPILSPTGRYDICTTLWLKYKGENSELYQLAQDTIRMSEGSQGGVTETEDIVQPDKADETPGKTDEVPTSAEEEEA